MRVDQDQFPGFQTLEFKQASWSRWAGSLAIHAALIGFLIAIPWTTWEVVQPRETRVVTLVDPALPLKHSPEPRLPALPIPALPIPALPIVVKQMPPPPVKRPIEFKAPPTLPVIVPKQIAVTEPPAPIPQPRQEMAKLVLPQIEPAPIPRPLPVVKTGGFGNPDGARPSVTAVANGPTAPQLGAFDLPPGSSNGRGNGARQVALAGFGDAPSPGAGQEGNGGHGSVRSAGFGDAAAGSSTGSQGNSRGSVRNAGFGGPETAAPVSHAALPAAPTETAVEITFKPKPAYTAEAREKKIEGEVLLEVLFLATGRIQVLRVMRGLGFGLDENAREAASQIRFQPGTRGGASVDMKATVRIVFELS